MKEDKVLIRNKLLKFAMPICESVESTEGGVDSLFVRGTAINSTTTRNGHTFLADELSQSVNSLKNKPVLKDHLAIVDNIIGRTTENVYFDPSSQSIKFEARIIDGCTKDKIKNGLITDVSVGAMVREIEEGEDGTLIARGIDFVELSVVAVPADPNAGFAKAMLASFNEYKTKTEEKMVENKVVEKTEEKVEEKVTEVKDNTQLTELASQFKSIFELMKKENEELKESISKMSSEMKEMKEVKEEKKEDKTMSVVVKEESKPREKYDISIKEFGGKPIITANSYSGTNRLARKYSDYSMMGGNR